MCCPSKKTSAQRWKFCWRADLARNSIHRTTSETYTFCLLLFLVSEWCIHLTDTLLLRVSWCQCQIDGGPDQERRGYQHSEQEGCQKHLRRSADAHRNAVYG